jgi:serine/threonine protein kinase
MAKLVKAGEFVGRGEEKAACCLEVALPDDWVVICNKDLVAPDGTVREIDFIVIGEHSVFSIEEKSWSGPIHGNENGWVLSSGESFRTPLQTVDAISRRLAGLLRRNVPLLAETVIGHFVFGRVLLSADNAQVFVHDARVANQVLRLDGAAEELLQFDRLQAGAASIRQFRPRIAQSLFGLSDRPTIPRRVGDYEILQSLSSAGACRRLRARHPDGGERLLKLIERPVTADRALREAEEIARLREYQALRRLGDGGRAPRVDAYFSWDQERYWVLPIYPIAGRSLRADRTDAAPGEDAIAQVAGEAFAALGEVHAAGVTHRALTPDRIYLRVGGCVAFTEFLIARIEGEHTVAGQVEELDPEHAYRAPECRVDPGLAVSASDAYGLAASLIYWISGEEPEGGESPASYLERASAGSSAPERQRILKILGQCLSEDERERPSVGAVVEEIRNARERQEVVLPIRRPLAELSPGDTVADQYKILRVLGRGGTATTYLAEDLQAESYFVLKAIRNPELAARLARNEFRSLMSLHHANLVRIFDIRPPSHPFHLKLEYVHGAPLKDVMERYRGNREFCLHIARQVLDALAFLADHGLIHRDVSPGNILIHDEESGPVKLIDFGLATTENDTLSAVGTPRYRAPEIDRGGAWSPGSDLYSLGVVLFELLTGRLPYPVEDGIPRKETPVWPSEDECRAFGGRFLQVLLKATTADPGRRFPSAAEFKDALQAAVGPEPEPIIHLKERRNPFVDELRATYRNSCLGNGDNRGLDTPFARDTYVPTRLDRELLPRLVDGEYCLVILCGNPGDGKTAFLQRVRDELGKRELAAERDDAAGWRLRVAERTFAALYDASESHEGSSADALLHEILAPLAGAAKPDVGYTAAIAANDGRLLDFFERHGVDRYPWLWDQVRAQLQQGAASDPSVLVVDLKHRSLVGPDPGDPSLFGGILDHFVDASRWEACEGCAARAECPIRFNALSLRDPTLAPAIRPRLHQMLLAVHLRRERRPTVRDLRSALAFLITHDIGCDQIHAERGQGDSPLARVERLYSNAAFDGSGGPDLLLDEWRQLDPADRVAPRLDRFLHFHRHAEQANLVRAAYLTAAGRPDAWFAVEAMGEEAWLASMKRRYWFEALSDAGEDRLGALPSPSALFPYRHFAAFNRALEEGAEDVALLERLALGIARADGVPECACRNALSLRLTENEEDDLVVVKRFPLEQFGLRRRGRGTPETDRRSVSAALAEHVPDQLVLQHRGGWARLTIGLDLFEFLMRAADGYLPGPEEERALVEDLDAFKNLLLSHPTQEVLLIERGLRTRAVRVVDGQIRREEASSL